MHVHCSTIIELIVRVNPFAGYALGIKMATSEDKEKAKKRKRNEDDGSKELDNGGEKFTFFFGADSPFSQWHPAKFEVDGVTYNCAEQYMMYQKAGEPLLCSPSARWASY